MILDEEIPEWSNGAVCKTVIRRFKSDSSLKATLPVYDAPVVKLGRHASFRVLYRKVWGFESLQAHKAVSDGHISPTFVGGNMLNGNETALL